MSGADNVPVLSTSDLKQPELVAGYQATTEYQYQPFKDNNSIRLLTLAAGRPNDPLKGRLEIIDVDATGQYDAISYVWADAGPQNCKYEISIYDGENESLLGLEGGSIFAALNRVRLPDGERRIWADQICINQKNLDERSQQVQFMNKIYTGASHVLVWLGLDEEQHARPAFDLIHQLDKNFHDEIKHREFHLQYTHDLENQSAEEWQALHHLTARPWVSTYT